MSAGLVVGYAAVADGATFSASYIGAATGTYSAAANWSGGIVPTTNNPAGGDFWNVTINRAGGSSVSAAGSFEVLNLTIGVSNQLTVPSAATFSVIGSAAAGTASIVNNGTINLLGLTGGTLRLRGSFTNLSGAGTINLTFPSTIRGEGGTLLISNTIIGAGTIGLGSLAITNTGTMIAQGGALHLLPHPTAGFINQNALMAAANSTLQLLGGGTYANSGTIQAQGSGTIAIIDAVRINGGTLSVASFGTMLVQTPAATFSGVQILNNGSLFLNHPGVASTIRLGGTLSGNGVTTLGSVPSATLTLASTGAATFLTNNSTIRGNGLIGLAGTGLINNAGTITANESGHDLTLGNGVSINNTGGTISASAGTIRLALTSGTSVTGSGTIQASGTGSIQFGNNVALIGQTLASSGSGVFAPVPAGGVLTLTNVINNASLTHGGGTLAISAPSMTNNGTVTMRTDGSTPGAVQLANNTTVTLNGTGRLVLDALNISGAPHIASTGTLPGTLVNTAAHTIEGEGTIGVGTLAIRNAGIIRWTGNAIGMTISPSLPSAGSVGLVNTGRIDAAGTVAAAALTIDSATGINNVGGMLRTVGPSTLAFNGGGTITGGELDLNSSGTLRLTGGTLTLAGVSMRGQGTITGTSTLVNTGGTIELVGQNRLLNPMLVNSGTILTGITPDPVTTLFGGPGAIIENSGTIAADNSPLSFNWVDSINNTGWIRARSNDLRVEVNTRIEGTGTLSAEGPNRIIFKNATIIGNTLIGDQTGAFQVESGGVTLWNARIFHGTSMSGPGAMGVGLTGTVENLGTISGAVGSTLTLQPDNNVTTQLTGGGVVQAALGGTLSITGTGTLQSDNLLNFGSNARLNILSRALINDGAITSPASISGTGTTLFRNNDRVNVTGATSLDLAQPVENNGLISIFFNGTLMLNTGINGGTIINTGGRIQTAGALRELTNVRLFNNNSFVSGVVDTAAAPLRLTNATVTNAGFIGPFGAAGASVEFVGGTVANTGRISTYALRSGAAIAGGTLTGQGRASWGSVGNVTNTGTLIVDSLGFLTLDGSVVNNGQIVVSSSALIAGGGTITLSGSGAAVVASNGQVFGNGTLVNSAGHRIIGEAFGPLLGDGTLNIRNAGLIRAADGAFFGVNPGPAGLVNSGTMGALNGSLLINGGVIQNAGGIMNANSGTITFFNSSVIGGEFRTFDDVFIGRVIMDVSGVSGSGTLANVNNTGLFEARSSDLSRPLNLVGTIGNTGTLDLRTRVVGGSATINNTGQVRVAPGVDASIGTIAGNGTVLVNSATFSAATLTSTQIRSRSLSVVASSGLAPARVNLGSSLADTSRIESVFLGVGTTLLNVSGSTLVYDYTGASPFNTVRQQVTTGYHGGAWNGTGIISDLAAATPGRGVGYAEATDLFTTFPATFAGESIDDTAVLIRYTLQGDANLDRVVNIADFSVLAANFNQLSNWARGDFNYDGTTGIADFSLLAANFNQSLPVPAARGGAVPEPAGAFFIAGLVLLCRRRVAGAPSSSWRRVRWRGDDLPARGSAVDVFSVR